MKDKGPTNMTLDLQVLPALSEDGNVVMHMRIVNNTDESVALEGFAPAFNPSIYDDDGNDYSKSIGRVGVTATLEIEPGRSYVKTTQYETLRKKREKWNTLTQESHDVVHDPQERSESQHVYPAVDPSWDRPLRVEFLLDHNGTTYTDTASFVPSKLPEITEDSYKNLFNLTGQKGRLVPFNEYSASQ